MVQTLQEFNKIYRYKSDFDKYSTNLDIWEVPEIVNGFVHSDCESYCRFLKSKIKGFEDWEYYYCKLGGNGHCILYKNGDVIDCNSRVVMSLDQYSRIYSITELKKYSWFVIASKIAFAKVYTWVN